MKVMFVVLSLLLLSPGSKAAPDDPVSGTASKPVSALSTVDPVNSENPVKPARQKRCKKADTGSCWGYWGESEWYRSPRWWAGEAAILGLYALDVYSTERGLRNNPGLTEGNVFTGPHPSHKRLIVMASVAALAESGFHFGAHHVTAQAQGGGYHLFGDVIMPLVVASVEVPAIVHNWHLGECYGTNLSCK